MATYYNEIDPYACAWLRNLIAAGYLPAGAVDERSIRDVAPDDLRGFSACHFFAGIGGWPYALELAGWPDDRPVWTGSCPCQPFSVASAGIGFDDERHLWPELRRLITERRPPVVFGEQVAGTPGLAWLDLVQDDLEAADYAVGSADICAAGIGAPHIRQRLYWVAHRPLAGLEVVGEQSARAQRAPAKRGGALGELGYADGERGGRDARAIPGAQGEAERSVRRIAHSVEFAGAIGGGLADAASRQLPQPERRPEERNGARLNRAVDTGCTRRPGPTNGFWRDADWLLCRDDKWRPVEPGSFPLAYGVPARLGRLRGYGNAIVAPLAAEFVQAFMECAP